MHLDDDYDILEPGEMLDNRYEIQKNIKAGNMGSVYKALDHRLGKKVCAVKELLSDPDDTPAEREYLIKRFKKEAEILNELRHPNLPVVKDYFIDDERYYIVMDYIEGRDLEIVMEKEYQGEGIPEKIVIEWAKNILDALDYLHTHDPPIIYRDLKPQNVMLRKSDNKVMLIDFGIARTINPGSDTTMTAIGTPEFAPEELYMGKPEPRTDLYSLGATMHCLLTGVMPQKLLVFDPVTKLNPKVSKELEAIVMKALKRKPKDRFKNAREMKEAIYSLPGQKRDPEDSGGGGEKKPWWKKIFG